MPKGSKKRKCTNCGRFSRCNCRQVLLSEDEAKAIEALYLFHLEIPLREIWRRLEYVGLDCDDPKDEKLFCKLLEKAYGAFGLDVKKDGGYV